MLSASEVRPYRVIVFAQGVRPVRRYKRHTKIAYTHYAYHLWTPEQHYQEARLPSAGSFLFPGIHRVRDAAMAELSKANVTQVQVRTDQDRKVYLWNKHKDGTVTGYMPE